MQMPRKGHFSLLGWGSGVHRKFIDIQRSSGPLLLTSSRPDQANHATACPRLARGDFVSSEGYRIGRIGSICPGATLLEMD